MCGICGVVIDGSLGLEERRWVEQMSRRLVHRGPDDKGFFFDGHAGLGSRRLAIVDIPHGHQPLGNESGAIQVVFNGELYNYRDLRKELADKGHRFTTHTDTEVLVHGYEEEGAGFVRRLNGIFSFAIWDGARRCLTLARDPLGVKPLYYATFAGGLVFASEIKALVSLPFVSAEVDPEAFELYLAYRFVPSPRTMFKGIRKLSPGELLTKRLDEAPEACRYTPEPPLPDDRRRAEEWEEALLAELRAAVHRQMMGDVPVGVLLSGGIDSAAVLAYAAEADRSGLCAYTVGFAGASREDETCDAAESARYFGVEHKHVTMGITDYRASLLASAFHLDEPVGTPSVAPYRELCRLAGSQRKVVLCGQGADEVFGGYPRHSAERLAGSGLGRILAGAARLASSLVPSSQRLERSSRMLSTSDRLSRFAETLALFPFAERRRLTGMSAGKDLALEAIRPRVMESSHLDPLGGFLYVDSRFGLPDDLLMYGDKLSMAYSLEVRVPFLDLEFLKLAERIPAGVRVGLLRPKRLLRRALRRKLPPRILRRRKRNFSPPEGAWLTPSRNVPNVQWLLEEGAAIGNYCRKEEVRRLTEEQASGVRDWRRQLFALLAFEIWHRTFLSTPRRIVQKEEVVEPPAA